jgi:hypothetical protein
VKSGNRYIIGRDSNVVRVDFGRHPDPPTPKFPGTAALRRSALHSLSLNAKALTAKKGRQWTEANP